VTDEPDSLRRWERWLGHVGYTAEGAIYLLMGLYALVADVERRRQPNGSLGTLAALGATPMGKALLALLTLGLAAFALWQLMLAIIDPEHRNDPASRHRRIVRLGHLFSGVLYSVILGQAVWSLFGFARGDGSGQTQAQWTSWVVRFPLGRYVVGVVGTGIAVFGCFQFYRALTRDKTKRVDLSRTRLRIVIHVLGVYGFISRGILFGLVGLYLVVAVWRLDARYSGGIAGALSILQRGWYGTWLLGAVAVGLISFGLFQITKERFRRFRDS
jgi:Domain of Unknown Function (DUF1206)